MYTRSDFIQYLFAGPLHLRGGPSRSAVFASQSRCCPVPAEALRLSSGFLAGTVSARFHVPP